MKLPSKAYIGILVLIVLLGWSPWIIKHQFFNTFTTKTNEDAVLSLTQEFEGSYSEAVKPNGNVVHIDLVADETDNEIAGYQLNNLFAYNGQVPGPIIRASLGDKIRVNFENKLPQETTIHWHGVRIPNAMDGVPGVTQSPIEPGETFTYEFIPKDAGTFWFHPHTRSSEQVEKGLYGVLIVEDPQEPVYEQEFVWILDDWKIDRLGNLYDEFNTPHDLMHDGRWGNIITVNGEDTPEFLVRPGERVRVRMINVANGRVFKPDFGSLQAQVIAVDGMSVGEPFELSGFELAPGNRVDVVLSIPRGKTHVTVKDLFVRGRPHDLAAIRAQGNEVSSDPTLSYKSAYIPSWSEGSRAPLSTNYTLNAQRGGQYSISWTMNDMAFPTHEAIRLEQGKFQKIRFENESARLHPMHLHGQFFKVLSKNGKAVDEPFFRDTVLVHPREIVEIGLVPLDSGRWMNHCHILEHAEAGMMTIIDVL